MRKISLLILSLVLIFVFASCLLFFPIDSTVIIRGTVTITRNGEPWNNDNFPLYYVRNSRDVGPPHDRPMLVAYSKEYGYIGEASVRYDTNSADYNRGKYQWALKISGDKLPCSIYFYVSCWMMDVYDSKGVDTGYFWISDRNTVTDLGIINYDVVKLFGNLPITVNGEACETFDDYSISMMNILIKSNSFPLHQTYPSYQTYIDTNGDWSLNIFQPESEIQAVFQVETDLLGGIFKKVMNPDEAIIIYDTDIEVIFPDFESVNFEALALSGTLKLPVADGRRLHIYLYYKNYTGSNSDTVLSGQEITWPEPDNNGLFEWKTMIPVYPLPFEIIARTELIKDVGMYRVDRYKSDKKIVITDTTDLSSIDLGDLKL